MSTVRLQAFAVIKPVHQSPGAFEILHGGSDIRRNVDKDGNEFTEILLDSVPFRLPSMSRRIAEVSKRKDGLYFLYGTRDSLSETAFWSAEARRSGAMLTTVEFEYDIGGQHQGLIDRKLLEEYKNESGEPLGFANFGRMKRTLQLELLAEFQRLIKDEDGSDISTMQSARDISSRPDLWAKIMNSKEKSMKIFKQIDVLVIPVADLDTNTSRQVAWVRPKTPMLSIMQSRTDIRLLNPSWMMQSGK